MRIQIFSDLHRDVRMTKPVKIVDGVEMVVVAGDTCEGALNAFEHLRRIVPVTIPIVMVLGNHEYYRRFVADELALARQHASTFNIHVLEDDMIVWGGVRFVGATLWTDYCAFGDSHITSAMNICAAGMNDHRRIGWNKQPWMRFRPQEAAKLHERSRSYIEGVLSGPPFAGPTVVVTHHAVHWDSILTTYRNDPLTAAFLSDLAALIEAHQPAMWVHGHVHNSCDYLIGRTRIVANPHGYGDENPAFDDSFVVQIDV